MLVGQEHLCRDRETNGEVGYRWRGMPTLILTTTGRRSSQPRSTPFLFGQDGGSYHCGKQMV
jgi:F420H(2)-dependent quinone reductase